MTDLASSALPAVPRPNLRTRLACAVGRAAAWTSRVTGRGSGGMIGGKVARLLAPDLLTRLTEGRQVVLVTGTNGKSTTTRMTVAALATRAEVATNDGGDNMEDGLAAALMAAPRAPYAVLEVDEMHLPQVAAQTRPAALVLLNLSRDQLDRVGEIGAIERRLRQAVNEHPGAVVVANADDPLVASAAWDAPRKLWVGAGAGWAHDSVTSPRTGTPVLWEGDDWYAVDTHQPARPGLLPATEFRRPQPSVVVDHVAATATRVPLQLDGQRVDVALSLPGRANRGNAAQAVAVAVALGAQPQAAATAIGTVREVAGRYARVQVGPRSVRMLLAKNPAGWQEAMSVLNPAAAATVVAVNGQIPDGEDLSWLWDVDFAGLAALPGQILACGERGADLAVRLDYAGIPHTLYDTPAAAIAACPAGEVDMLANYTAFRDYRRHLARTEGEK
ncbi:MurT ligase domain-containing protein [Buchananella hordeovulneris]|uniref:MurT ligase domain-containing protein n=1 Tax=Buchananella hordeovulneris TaxID=52770 RepID=UPI000F5F6996|nr:MurT ligase domain-containing protein [Buchananella hordeovulneris]RRD42863.1 DUF1727 domain-containing protein [Buchananella hordeovulneris]